jgi:hypothetical protein
VPLTVAAEKQWSQRNCSGDGLGHGKSTRVVPQYNRCLASITKSSDDGPGGTSDAPMSEMCVILAGPHFFNVVE